MGERMPHATLCAVAASTIRIAQVPVATLGAFLEACAGHPTDDLEDLAEFAGFSLSTAKRAVPTLESFGLVGRDGSGRYVARADGVRRGMDPDAREQVIRRGLLGYRPFEMLVEGLALGEDVDAAIRKALSLLDLPRSEAPKLRTLLRWGEDLSVLESDNGRVKLLAELGTESVEAVGPLSPEDVESEARARLFNARRLGRDANNSLTRRTAPSWRRPCSSTPGTRAGRSTTRDRRWRTSSVRSQTRGGSLRRPGSVTGPGSSPRCSGRTA